MVMRLVVNSGVGYIVRECNNWVLLISGRQTGQDCGPSAHCAGRPVAHECLSSKCVCATPKFIKDTVTGFCIRGTFTLSNMVKYYDSKVKLTSIFLLFSSV